MDHQMRTQSFCPLHFANLILATFWSLAVGYLICYLELSFLYIVVITILFVVAKKNHFLSHEKRALHDVIKKVACRFFTSKECVSVCPTTTVPSASDLEPAQWVNTTITQMWPYVTDYISQQVKEEIAKVFHVFKVKVTKVDLGTKTPQVNGITCKTPDAKDTIKFDVDVLFESDCFVELEKFGLYGGIKNFSARGLMCVQLEQLEKQYPPFAGTLTLCFYQDPDVNYDFTELAVILDLETVRTLIRESIAKRIVYPNKYVIPLPPMKQ